MLRLTAIASALMLFAAAHGQDESPASLQPATSHAGLTAEYLYNGVKRPVRLTVASPRSFGTITLALMDADGTPLAEPIEVHPGVIDLAEKLPAIWDIRRTAYLQMIDHETPVASALVLQPMLSRMIPLTAVKPHPVSGKPQTRIVGWVDENEPEMQEPAKEKCQNAKEQNAKPAAAASDGSGSDQQSSPATREPLSRLFSGLRIYPENDVILHTTLGDIRLAMKPDEAPNTVWNFLELCRGGFYRDVQFHRIVPLTNTSPPWPFVIQAGDPTATGDGGPGYWLPIEDSQLAHDFGVISMARSDDPDSNGSQFFICLSREGTARLDGQYCAFGYAVDGASTIMSIAQVRLADEKEGRPVSPPLIKSAELVPALPRVLNQGRPDQRVTPESKPAEPKPTGRIPR